MTDTINKLEYKNPGIENDINEALQRNIDAGLGKTGLGDVLGQAVKNAKERGEIYGLAEQRAMTREKYAGRDILQEVIDLKIDDGEPIEEKREKIAKALDCRPEQISFTRKEALSGDDIVYHYGSLRLQDLKSIKPGTSFPFAVGGHLDLTQIQSAKDIILPQIIGNDLYLNTLVSVENLTMPQDIGYSLILTSLESAKELVLPKSIGGSLEITRLVSAENITMPQSVGVNINLHSLKSAKYLILPQLIKGFLDLTSLESAEDLILPQTVGGSLLLGGLKSAENLNLPQLIGGYLDLGKLTSIEHLDLSNVDMDRNICFSKDTYDKYVDELSRIYPNLKEEFSHWS